MAWPKAPGNFSATAWGVDYDWIKSRYGSKELMEKPGMVVSRWFDGVLEKEPVR